MPVSLSPMMSPYNPLVMHPMATSEMALKNLLSDGPPDEADEEAVMPMSNVGGPVKKGKKKGKKK
jgi:hypothetical protein